MNEGKLSTWKFENYSFTEGSFKKIWVCARYAFINLSSFQHILKLWFKIIDMNILKQTKQLKCCRSKQTKLCFLSFAKTVYNVRMIFALSFTFHSFLSVVIWFILFQSSIFYLIMPKKLPWKGLRYFGHALKPQNKMNGFNFCNNAGFKQEKHIV